MVALAILGLVVLHVPSALSREGSWIAVSGPRPLRQAVSLADLAAALRSPSSLQRSLLAPLGDELPAARITPGQVTVRVAVGRPAAPLREVIRIGGADRYETALQASRDFDRTSTAVIATGTNWPDALGGTALAGAVRGPLLLTRTSDLPVAIRSELVRLGTEKVYILGGSSAVGPSVEQALTEMGLVVVRLGGVDRYATCRLVADETIRVLGGTYSGDALVATGSNFPDATGGSALAAALRRPILLVDPAGGVYVPSATRRVTILGGTSAVPAQVQMTLQARLGAANVVRAGGADRYETAVRVAQVGIDAGMTWNGVGIATGAAFPDALTGGAMLGAGNSVLLLSTPRGLSPTSEAALGTNAGVINIVHVFGGESAISPTAEEGIRRAIGIF